MGLYCKSTNSLGWSNSLKLKEKGVARVSDRGNLFFHQQDKLKRHYLVHESVKRFKCPYSSHLGCQKEFSRADKLKAHLVTHSGVRPYECRTCGRGFSQKQRLREHERLHAEVPRPSCYCPVCQQAFLGRKALEEHSCSAAGRLRTSRGSSTSSSAAAALRGRRRRLNAARVAKQRQQQRRLATTRDRGKGADTTVADGLGDIPTAHIEIITGDLGTISEGGEEPALSIDGHQRTTVLFRVVEEQCKGLQEVKSEADT